MQFQIQGLKNDKLYKVSHKVFSVRLKNIEIQQKSIFFFLYKHLDITFSKEFVYN